MTAVLLATCARFPEGEPFGDLVGPLRRHGVTASWATWDDPGVDWAGCDLVAVRSTWDYTGRRADFLAWARSLPVPLMNGADVLAWNTDKTYLLDLVATGLPVVPTVAAETRADVAAATERLGECVAKPTVGASGIGVVVLRSPRDADDLEGGPWVVQPLVGSVRTEGEHSVYVLGGELVSQARKRPAPGGSILVHEEYGGRTDAVPLDPECALLAQRAVEVAQRLLAVRLDYARVDLMRLGDGTLAVSELEVAEPGLYLDVLPGNADAFARAVARRLGLG